MAGFPHSEIHGSKPVHGSPWLIAVCHVLHRLSAPRHSPDALDALDYSHCHPAWEHSRAPCRMTDQCLPPGFSLTRQALTHLPAWGFRRRKNHAAQWPQPGKSSSSHCQTSHMPDMNHAQHGTTQTHASEMLHAKALAFMKTHALSGESSCRLFSPACQSGNRFCPPVCKRFFMRGGIPRESAPCICPPRAL